MTNKEVNSTEHEQKSQQEHKSINPEQKDTEQKEKPVDQNETANEQKVKDKEPRRVNIFQAMLIVAMKHHRTMMLLILSFFISTGSIEKSTNIKTLSIVIALAYVASTMYGFALAKGTFSFMVSEHPKMKNRAWWIRGLCGLVIAVVILIIIALFNDYMTDQFTNLVEHTDHNGFLTASLVLVIVAIFLVNFIEEIAILETVGYVDNEHERADALLDNDNANQSDSDTDSSDADHTDGEKKKREWPFRVILALMILFRK